MLRDWAEFFLFTIFVGNPAARISISLKQFNSWQLKHHWFSTVSQFNVVLFFGIYKIWDADDYSKIFLPDMYHTEHFPNDKLNFDWRTVPLFP